MVDFDYNLTDEYLPEVKDFMADGNLKTLEKLLRRVYEDGWLHGYDDSRENFYVMQEMNSP